MSNKLYLIKKIESMNDIQKLINLFLKTDRFLYRGQSNSEWSILTSIDKEIIEQKGIEKFKTNYNSTLKRYFEVKIWYDFRKRIIPDNNYLILPYLIKVLDKAIY